LQLQAFFWQPQEQVPHSHVPQQLEVLVFFTFWFFTFDMIVLPFGDFRRLIALSMGLTDEGEKHYSPFA